MTNDQRLTTVGRFLLRRLLLTIPVLLGVATLVFSLIHLVPGSLCSDRVWTTCCLRFQIPNSYFQIRIRRARVRSGAFFGSFSKPRVMVTCSASRLPARSCASASDASSPRSFGLAVAARSNQSAAAGASFRRSESGALGVARDASSGSFGTRAPYDISARREASR